MCQRIQKRSFEVKADRFQAVFEFLAFVFQSFDLKLPNKNIHYFITTSVLKILYVNEGVLEKLVQLGTSEVKYVA